MTPTPASTTSQEAKRLGPLTSTPISSHQVAIMVEELCHHGARRPRDYRLSATGSPDVAEAASRYRVMASVAPSGSRI